MGKHPIDHDRPRDAKVVREYARVEREQADPITDPKVRAMTKAAHKDEPETNNRRVRKFLNIDRQKPEP
jgi:hypothetical protein